MGKKSTPKKDHRKKQKKNQKKKQKVTKKMKGRFFQTVQKRDGRNDVVGKIIF